MKKIGLISFLAFCFFHFNWINAESIDIPILTPNSGFTYTINGAIQKEEYLYIYGFQRETERDDVNGLLIVYNTTTSTEEHIVLYEMGYIESFELGIVFSNDSIGIINKNYGILYPYQTYRYRSTEILRFDLDGNLLEKVILYDEFSNYNIIENQFVLTTIFNEHICVNEQLEVNDLIPPNYNQIGEFRYLYEGVIVVNDAFVSEILIDTPGIYHIELRNLDFSFDISLEPLIEGVIDYSEYNEDVIIHSLGELWLNNELYNSGDTISSPGNYQLEVKGVNGFTKQIHFSIHPQVLPVFEGYQESQSIRIYTNAVYVEINEKIYTGELLTVPGDYLLKLFGVENYEKQIHFEILPSLSGIEDGISYEENVLIQVNGEAYINGEYILNSYFVDSPGEYEVILMYKEETYQMYHFSVFESQEDSIEEENVQPFNELQYLLGGLILLGLFLIFRKK
ncbi:MAG: hypothetical protein KJ971_00420 [Firmicutes bacterium]|nr:hypothetical protein [Bacillota bacterium]